MSTKEITVRGWAHLEPGDVIVHADKTGAPPEFVVRREVPEIAPGTTGTATVRGVLSTRVIRLHPNVQDGLNGYAWASADLVDGKHKEINGYDGTFLHTEADVTGFAPDSTKTRLNVTKAVNREELAEAFAQHYGDHENLAAVPSHVVRQNYLDDADAILTLLGGES